MNASNAVDWPTWRKTVIAAIEGWLAQNAPGCGKNHYYSPEEWTRRGETVGRGSLLSINIEESCLAAIANVETAQAEKLNEAFIKFLTRFGVWYELGYGWSMHLYRF